MKGLGWREPGLECGVQDLGGAGVDCGVVTMKGLVDGRGGVFLFSEAGVRVAPGWGVPFRVREGVRGVGSCCCKAAMKGLDWREESFSSVRVESGPFSLCSSLSLSLFHVTLVVIDETDAGDGMSSTLPFRFTVAMGITRDWWIPFLEMTSGVGSVHCGVPLRLLFRLRESGRFMVGTEDIVVE